MNRNRFLVTGLPCLVAAALAGCGGSAAQPSPRPAGQLIAVPGSSVGKIVLSASGAERLGLQTATVRAVPPPPPPPPPPVPKTTSTHHSSAAAAAAAAAAAKAAAPPPPPPNPAKVIIPFSAIVYAPSGRTYAFTAQARLSFTEVPVTVDHVSGNAAYLRSGPRPGDKVVTVGAEELFGVQTGVLEQT